MSGPVVDVGMPAHGRADFIAEAIESVLAQSYPDWLLHIVDDGPGGGEIEATVRPYAGDPRVRYVATDQPVTANQAQTDAMRAGDSPYFAFLHDDDRWGPGFLERRVAFIEEHPECAFVFSGHLDVDESGQTTGRTRLPFEEGVVDRDEMLRGFYVRNVVHTMHSVVVRRSALEQVGTGVDPDFPRLYDWELWLRLAAHFPVGCLAGEDDVHYRVHPTQMSKRPGMGRDFLEMFERVDEVVAEHVPSVRLDEPTRRRARARLLLSVGLDELADRSRHEALDALAEARALDPRSVLNHRAVALLLGIALGPVGRRLVGRARLAAYRRGVTRA